MLCTACQTPLDAIWAQIGVDRHPTCEITTECEHGEPRGPRYCALCRRANPMILPPVPPERPGRRAKT